MARQFQTNADKILEVVLSQKDLIEYGNYDPQDFVCIMDALNSDNPIVHTVAEIIDSMGHKYSDRDIYVKIHNYLTTNL